MATDLLLITPGFPADEGDSTCIPPLQVYLLALRKSRPELRIAVIATQYPNHDRPYQWHGIAVHPCNGRNKWYWKFRTWRRAANACQQLHADGGVRTIHSLWLGECAMLGSRFAKSAGIRHLLTLMGQDARDGIGWWRRIQRPSSVVCLTERHAAYFADMSGTTADAILPWGIDQGSLAPSSEARDIDLLWCGSFIPVKQPLHFVLLAGDVQEHRAVKVVMVGDGELREELHRQAMGGHGSNVEFTGTLDRPEVLALMQRSKVLVHTSTYESQGFVFDECLLNGMSIVSTAVGSAMPSDRWVIANEGSFSFRDSVIQMLDTPRSMEALVLHPLSATVNEYLRLYGLG